MASVIQARGERLPKRLQWVARISRRQLLVTVLVVATAVSVVSAFHQMRMSKNDEARKLQEVLDNRATRQARANLLNALKHEGDRLFYSKLDTVEDLELWTSRVEAWVSMTRTILNNFFSIEESRFFSSVTGKFRSENFTNVVNNRHNGWKKMLEAHIMNLDVLLRHYLPRSSDAPQDRD